MKLPFQRLRNLTLLLLTVSCFLMFSCKADETDKVLPDYDISGNAAGMQVFPSVSGTGSASISGSFNPNNRLLTYASTWANLSGAPTGGGIYAGAAGVTGVALTTFNLAGSLTAAGSTSGSLVLTPEQAEQLLLGRIYFEFRTAFNPSGEVRGQVNTSR